MNFSNIHYRAVVCRVGRVQDCPCCIDKFTSQNDACECFEIDDNIPATRACQSSVLTVWCAEIVFNFSNSNANTGEHRHERIQKRKRKRIHFVLIGLKEIKQKKRTNSTTFTNGKSSAGTLSDGVLNE